MIARAPSDLRELVERLTSLADRRLQAGPRNDAASARARQLADHLRGHVRVRADSLDAPLVVLLVGPTGAGKSTIFNTIAGLPASETGVLRPTTRVAVVLVHPADRRALADGALAGIPTEQLRYLEVDDIEPGLALVDTPDIDSVERANRALADRLVEAADLCCFVTTATRYADQVPWSVLDRVRQRGLPLLVIVNRMPPGSSDRAEVLADIERLLTEAGMRDLLGARPGDAPHELVAVQEGALDPAGDRVVPSAIGPVTEQIARLRADREARVELAARALSGALAGLGDTLDRIADDAEHEAIDVEALRRTAERSYEVGLTALHDELSQGTFLREEALRRWQSFVGADQMTRFFSEGIGRIRGALAAMFRPATAPVAEISASTTDDLLAIARLQAGEAARRTATAWAEEPGMRLLVAEHPELWLPAGDFEERLQARIEGWMASIVEDIQAHGGSKRSLARGASISVNVLGTGVMLATFLHTGGLTGAEVGIVAATALLNQKLLSALFGEAAMVELVSGAQRRLDAALTETFDEERARFDRMLPPADALPQLAREFRAAATDVRALPTVGS